MDSVSIPNRSLWVNSLELLACYSYKFKQCARAYKQFSAPAVKILGSKKFKDVASSSIQFLL